MSDFHLAPSNWLKNKVSSKFDNILIFGLFPPRIKTFKFNYMFCDNLLS